MATADDAAQKKTVCVTGASGFIASSLVKRLLQLGYVVHATVRDPADSAKVQHLLQLPRAEENLRLFKAELREEGSFDAAVAGCQGVFHVASPVVLEAEDPENDLIKPAVAGTLNVLESCRKTGSVKRVVVTSSAAALVWTGDGHAATQSLDESSWSDVNFLTTQKTHGWAYMVAKTEAERAALQFGEANDGIEIATVVTVVVAGPSLTPSVPSSVAMLASPLTGDPGMVQAFKGIELGASCIPLVHVDDLCEAHVFLYESPSTKGRHVCSSATVPLAELARLMRDRYPRYCKGPNSFADVGSPRRIEVSSKKLVEMGFCFKHDLNSLVDQTVEYLKRKGVVVLANALQTD